MGQIAGARARACCVVVERRGKKLAETAKVEEGKIKRKKN
jgi:hypothetical protein